LSNRFVLLEVLSMNDLFTTREKKRMSNYVIKENAIGLKAIFHKNSNAGPVSGWWPDIHVNGLVEGRSKYYVVTNYKGKMAAFHVDSPDTPISQWWKFIFPFGGVFIEVSEYYEVKDDSGVTMKFHKDDPNNPVERDPIKDYSKETGLIFKEEDINNSPNTLVKLLRAVFYENEITYEYLNEKIVSYHKSPSDGIPTRLPVEEFRSNMIDAILDPYSVTFPKFRKALSILFGDADIIMGVTIIPKGDDGLIFRYPAAINIVGKN